MRKVKGAHVNFVDSVVLQLILKAEINISFDFVEFLPAQAFFLFSTPLSEKIVCWKYSATKIN